MKYIFSKHHCVQLLRPDFMNSKMVLYLSLSSWSVRVCQVWKAVSVQILFQVPLVCFQILLVSFYHFKFCSYPCTSSTISGACCCVTIFPSLMPRCATLSQKYSCPLDTRIGRSHSHTQFTGRLNNNTTKNQAK